MNLIYDKILKYSIEKWDANDTFEMKYHKAMRRSSCSRSLNKAENNIFPWIPESEKDWEQTIDEDLPMHSLENNRNVIVIPADKSSSIALWDRLIYLEETVSKIFNVQIKFILFRTYSF